MNDKETVESLAGQLMEQLADAEHASWAHWMRYLLSQCERLEVRGGDGEVIVEGMLLPKNLVERWTRQAQTSYIQLSNTEQESDREEVRKILPFISAYVRGLTKLVADSASLELER